MSKIFGKIVNKRNAKKVKFPLRRQMTLVFAAVMIVTLVIIWIINNLFLERYYISKQEKTLRSLYNTMNVEAELGNIASTEFDLYLQQYSSAYNVSIVIISSSFEPIRIYATDPHDIIMNEIRQNLSGRVTVERLIEQNKDYVFIQKKDGRLNTDYIEMWGALSDGSFFMIRVALESIRTSTAIASRFVMYIGLGAMVISAIVIDLATKRITKPILELADISEKISGMDFSEKYNDKNNNEIDMLGRNVNIMSKNLEEAIYNLKDANAALQKDIDLKERIDEMRKEFVSNVSHELKTPIALIQGYAEGLKEGINDEDEKDYYCDVIIDESAKMNRMVKQLLSLNQLESGYYELEIREFDIMILLRNYIQSSDILTKGKNISVSINGPESVLVYADEYKIEETIMNYFSNAINHCDSPNEKRIDVTVETMENSVKVNVFNTGNPIPEESIDHLFDKFYKVDKARTRAYGGSGVGLSIVKAIIEAHHCECGVENYNDGVNFWFTLKTDSKFYNNEEI